MSWHAAPTTSERRLRWFLPVTAALAVASYIAVYSLGLADRPIRSDALSYYLYLPSWFLDHDPTFDTEAIACCEGAQLPGALRWPANHRWIDPVPIGVAVLMTPFFAAAHLLTRWSNMPPDGYSLYYQHGAGLAGLAYFLLGLAVLRNYLQHRFTAGVTVATLVTLTYGTNLFHYGTYDSTFSHAYSFFLITVLLVVTERWWERPTWSNTFGMGVVAGLIALTRLPNGLFVALVPLYDVRRIWERRVPLIAAAIVAVAVVFPQLLIYKLTTGHWFVNAYVGGGFTFASPHLFGVLFSVQKGLFFWSPVLLLAVVGLCVARGASRRWALPVGLVLAADTYVIASWTIWTYGGSYGHRAFTDAFGLLALFVAAAFEWVAERPRIRPFVGVAVSLAVALSLVQMVQYWIGVIPIGGPTWAEYRALFLRFR